ncbi:MAG: Eco57I restriction-modification methylase domain-containing protein [Anaerolineae bacterium]|nr:Eco57I restriction-modification methylase domain-containing protein [Anaerolineae bacterium]
MTQEALQQLEVHRLELQAELDAAKSKRERNQLGQFATPSRLATAILQQAERLLPSDQPVRFLDPAIGTGAFYSALLHVFPEQRIVAARGYEVDPHYGEPSRLLWRDRHAEIVIGDFTQALPPEREVDKFSLLICNPPYVRHHHIPTDDKKRLQTQAARTFHTKLSGLAGMYVYFVGIAHAWLREGGIAGWLIPSEFMDVNYGSALRHYLTSQVTLLEIHRFDPLEVQFDDALVSSVIVWFRKQKPHPDHGVQFSLGGRLDQPKAHQQIALSALCQETKWTRFPTRSVRFANETEPRFRDLFEIKRGIATGANEFFILDSEQVCQHELPDKFLTPILPSPRYLESDEIAADTHGNPLLKRLLFLLDCDIPEDQVERHYPTLWRYLQLGIVQGIPNGYLCRHRPFWYAQDKRTPSPFLCTYMGRPSNGHTVNPFRFILNHSRAVAPNVYLNIYPNRMLTAAIAEKPDLKRTIWESLQAITVEMLVDEGRVYGGGLYKLEPNELGNLPVTAIFDWHHEFLAMTPQQEALF